jgi:hypothetical protein
MSRRTLISTLNHAMTIHLPADLEAAVSSEAQRLGTTPQSLVEDMLRFRFLKLPKPGEPMTPEESDEWLRRLKAIAQPCGVSLTDEQLSRETMYD